MAEKIAAKQQLTNIPTIYLTVPDAIGKDINSVLTKDRSTNTAEYHNATIQVVDNNDPSACFTDEVQIKVRGNSTADDGKKPYRLKFGKDVKDAAGNVIESHKHDMLGTGFTTGPKRNWTLLTNHKDKSLLRNALTYHVGKAVGMDFCPGYKFVDLVINGEYRGNYQISDHVEVGKNRIDIDEDTGWFIETNGQTIMAEEPKTTAAGITMSIKNPEPATEAETAKLKADVSAYFNKLNYYWGIYGKPCSMEEFVNGSTGWTAYIDEESLAKFYIGINLTDDYDGFMTVKAYREVDGKLKFGPLWDKDLAYGNWQNHGKLAEEYQPGYTFCDHMTRMMTDPYFVKKVHGMLHEIVTDKFVENLQKQIYAMGTEISESQKLNQSKWWTCDDYPAAQKEFADYIAEHTAFFVDAIDEKYQTMGCAELGERPGGTGPGPGGSDGHVCPYETTLGEWNNTPLPSSAIHPRATAVKMNVVGTSFFRLLNSNDENDKIGQYSFEYDGANMSGREFNITDEETLNKLKDGSLYIRCGGGSATVTITCTVPEGGDETDTPTPAERAQLTNLPTIYLDATVGNDWTGASLEVFDADNKLGQGAKWTKTTADVSVQFQGSGDKNKDSYRLKFESKTQLLSSGKFKQWVLLANDDDPTMMRNALAKEMGDALGLPFTPGYQFVDLYVNNTYMGTYQVTDRIKVEAGRALVTGGNKDNDWHVRLNDEGEYKEDKPTYYIAGNTTAPYIIPKNPDPKDDVTTWNSTLKSAMTTYFNNVFSTTGGKYTAFAENVDKQQLIQWYIAQEMLGVYKGFSSIETYRSVAAADQNLHIGILWDSEKAFGNTGEAPAINMADLETAGSYDGLMTNYAAYDVMKNIFTQLWQERWFANGVNNLWKEKHETMLTAMTSKATALKTELEGSWAQNATKWNITGEQAASINAMTAWLIQRDAYLTKKFAALAAALPCETHTYENHNYIEQTNGTFLLGCDVCGAIKEGSETYYKFLVYPESEESTEIIATSWHPSEEHPNSIAVVEAEKKIVEKIDGYNIVCGKKSTLSDGTKGLTCKDFRLTDGHPYYSDNKFVATTATYTRPLAADEVYGMMTLPFKHQNAENDDATFYHIEKVEGDKIHLVAIDPSIDGNASAYLPVIFKRKDGATSITVTGTDITVKKTSADKTNSTFEGWTIIGAVESTSVTADGLYKLSDAKLGTVVNAESLTVAPFRAYLSTTATDVPATLTFVCPGGEEVTVTTLVEAIKQLINGNLTKQDIEKIVNELLNKE